MATYSIGLKSVFLSLFSTTLAPLAAQSLPIHRYSFSETSGTSVPDSRGSAHGVIRGSGAVWDNGKLRLPGGNSSSAAYVDLPNGLISGLTDVTFEAWVSVDGSQTWSRIFDFGSSNFVEVTGPGGGGEGRDYFFLGATRGNNTNQQRIELRNEDPAGGGISTADSNLPTILGNEYHHVVTYDADGGAGQARMKYYRDGVLVAQTDTPTQLNQINDVNNWLGRSNWTADSNLQGTFNEFRIYEVALEQDEVTDSRAFGPDQLLTAAPVIESFTSDPTSIFEGQSSTLSWDITGVTGTLAISIAPTPGAITGNPANGSHSVSPESTTTYTLTATDSSGTREAEVTIVVDPGIPIANPLALETNQNTAVTFTLDGSDPNGGILSYEILSSPSFGSLSGTAPNLTYSPSPGFTGNDGFTFSVDDGKYDSDQAAVSITVNHPPSPPSNISLSSLLIPSEAVSGSLISKIEAADHNDQDRHSFSLVDGPGDSDNDRFQISANNLLTSGPMNDPVGTPFGIRLRATDTSGLSVERAFVLTIVEAPEAIVINEIHFDPEDSTQRGEFIELYNPGPAPVDLSGWFFDDGITYTFPESTLLNAESFLVVAQDPSTILASYGVPSLGPWTGRLDGEGEELTLRRPSGVVVDTVDYRVGFPWPIASGGDGASMELLTPSLDNDLGSSWRASQPPGDLPEAVLLPYASSGWSWRPGNTEASSPIESWRGSSFVEDGSWTQGVAAPIGYGSVTGLPLNTVISGMEDNYTCFFARNTFEVAAGEVPSSLIINTRADDGYVIWINGVEVDRRRFTGTPLTGAFAQNQGSEGAVDTVTVNNAASFLVEGNNTIAVQLFNASLGSSDAGLDVEVIRPPSSGQPPRPTPGAQNSVHTENAPPNIRQVNHSPQTPRDSEPVTITAKITDPQGVDSVALKYQIVLPGQFIPSRTPRSVSQILADPEANPPLNPAFEDPSNWTEIPMTDDGSGADLLAGDGIYTALLPAQAHRTLVRYRIVVTDLPGASIQVPYSDDRSLNFAYFVYNGVPDFVASSASVHPDGPGHVWTAETLNTLPVYHWLIRPQDMQSLQAYESSQQFSNTGSSVELAARRAYDWEGAMVYDGVVYDHIRARLRGGNSRYGDFDGRFPRGKRHYKFRFNRGHHFAAKDEMGRPYERKWRIFNVSRMFGTKGGNSWGLPEEIGDTLYHTMGVPTQRAHWFHFRVIDGAQEAPDQFNGDFWGIQQAQERYDVRFLESRKMAKGNLYKLSDFFFDAESQRRYQSPDMVSDGSEFDNIRFNLHGGQTATWLNEHVNYEKWYGYSAVGEAIRHYDIFPEPTGRHRLKNLVWYFEPTGSDRSRGICWELPYDYDASWGPNFNNGWDHANNGLYGRVIVNSQPYIDKPQMKIAHRNVLRSFRDLVWQPDQVGGLLDDRASFISKMSMADQDRWRSAPLAAGTAMDDPLDFKVQDMKNFAFNGWSGGSGPNVGPGGRGAFLDSIADGPDAGQLPSKPIITSIGPEGFPVDALQFETSNFSDPQGPGTFASLEWRIGEIEDPSAPAWDPENDFILENDLVWGSGELTSFKAQINIPPGALRVGHTYRVRVRHHDSSGRASHWSDPVEFTTAEPVILPALQDNLMITEIMYHPASPNTAELTAGFSESDFEFIELQNISDSLTLDLSAVRFTKGIDFDFSDGIVTTLGPGQFVLVVKNVAAFQFRYGSGLPVAGTWNASQSLSNGGERIKLSYGAGTGIHDFEYDDIPPWPVAADGSGRSLELKNPPAAPDHGLATSWHESLASLGTPGATRTSSPFLLWMDEQGTSDPAEPWGSTNLSHLLAYALGADLASVPPHALSRGILIEEAGLTYPALRFRHRKSAAHTTTTVEISNDLKNWGSDTLPYSIEDHGDGTETITVRSDTPITELPRQFFRILVTHE